MAAGLGTRLRPFTELVPKVFLPLLGEPIIQFSMDQLVYYGVEEVVANIHYMPERSRKCLQDLEKNTIQLSISDEASQLLGSAGAIRKAIAHFGSEPFFLINGDVLAEIDLHALACRHLQLKRQFGVLLTLAVWEKPPSSKEYYTEILLDHENGLISGLRERQTGKPGFASVAVIEPEALHEVPLGSPSELVAHVLSPAIEKKRAGYFMMDGFWLDVGSSKLWFEAHRFLVQGLETGRVPILWRKRIEKRNRRLGQEIWTSLDSPRILKTIDWSGPCYWSPSGDPSAEPPTQFGPNAFGYGELSEKQGLQNGIGFGRNWDRIY